MSDCGEGVSTIRGQPAVTGFGEWTVTAIDFPPMQPGASFNLSAIKEKIQTAMANRAGN